MGFGLLAPHGGAGLAQSGGRHTLEPPARTAFCVLRFALNEQARRMPTVSYFCALATHLRPHDDYLSVIRNARGTVCIVTRQDDELFRAKRFADVFKNVGTPVPVTMVPGVNHFGLRHGMRRPFALWRRPAKAEYPLFQPTPATPLSMPTRLNPEAIEKLARTRAGAKLGWYGHAGVFVLVNARLLGMARYSFGRRPWAARAQAMLDHLIDYLRAKLLPGCTPRLQLPVLDTGVELAAAWPAWQPFPALVFVTAYGQYAVQAFEAQAMDYLLKAVQAARLQKNCVKNAAGAYQQSASSYEL